ncbi:MAG: hypothetical protein EKK40_07165 [Bradyrhizobiaceae bacterium]|nr:MAG: hypothetical protein EKK40_07165 [Bradyrhizobiaceae bacterium]
MAGKYDNSGALFKNDRKEKDSHPDYSGNITVDGRDYWLSAWVKDGGKGKFFSLAVKPKEAKRSERSDPISTGRPRNDDVNDDIPFAPEVR